MQLTMVVNYVLDKNVQLRTEMDTVLQHCTNQKVKTLRLIACIYIYIYIYSVTLLVLIVSGADVVMQNVANITKTWNRMTKVRRIST